MTRKRPSQIDTVRTTASCSPAATIRRGGRATRGRRARTRTRTRNATTLAAGVRRSTVAARLADPSRAPPSPLSLFHVSHSCWRRMMRARVAAAARIELVASCCVGSPASWLRKATVTYRPRPACAAAHRPPRTRRPAGKHDACTHARDPGGLA